MSYPGYEIFPNVKLHIFSGKTFDKVEKKEKYSAPIWFALVTNIIVILIIEFFFVDISSDYTDGIGMILYSTLLEND